MCYDVNALSQATSGFPFWLETLSIFVGDVLATFFIGGGAYLLWYVLKYPGFRVGASWTYIGWDMQKMGRLPDESDDVDMQLMPNISVATRDMTVRKVIAAVWVRERADIHDTGEIHGMLDLRKAGIPVDVRTTGGDLLALPGPTIPCKANKFQRICNCPIFIQTSDGEFYKAQSPGNTAKGVAKLRHALQNVHYDIKERLLSRLR